jgi:peptidoglycan/xylan/chitin deacetylase (PgdA/CDA1 family)
MRWRAGTAVLGLAVLTAGLSVPADAVVGQPGGARPGVVRSTTWMLRTSLSAGPSQVQFTFGLPGDRKVMGDWNGDGTRTPGVFRAGAWYLRDRNGAGGTYFSFVFGAAGDQPVVGDWNGDGIETVGFFRNGEWHLRDANSTGPSQYIFVYGQAGDVPVTGDWNADGVDGVGFYRLGEWHLRDALGGGASNYIVAAYGLAGDTPVTGDWDRNGSDSIGIVQGSYWHLKNRISGGSSDLIFPYGTTGDTPVVWKQAVPTVPASLRGNEWTVLPTSRKVVALTFDAGGDSAGVTKILSTLAANRVAATFFLTGRWIENYRSVATQIGTSYPVGNHTYSHPDLTTQTDAQVRDQIVRAETLIRSATAQDPRPLFRFPFGARDARTTQLANGLSYGSIRWTVDTLGWQGTSGGQSAQTVVSRVLSSLRPGEIVLMHVGGHPTDHSTLDADALPTLIQQLRARGYGFTTVRQYS